jgi:hypothetical protein
MVVVMMVVIAGNVVMHGAAWRVQETNRSRQVNNVGVPCLMLQMGYCSTSRGAFRMGCT